MFHALERCNWLIFQDAFPQLLLYHFSKAERRPLFDNVCPVTLSGHMQPVWDGFWESRESDRLAWAAAERYGSDVLLDIGASRQP